MLDVVCRLGAVAAVPVCAVLIYTNAQLARWDLVTLSSVAGAGLVALGVARDLSYRWRARGLCAAMGLAAIGTWFLGGYVLESAGLHVAAVLLTALLLGRRAATTALLVLTLAFTLAAMGHLHALLPTDPQIQAGGHAANNWMTAGMMLTALTLMLGTGLTLVIRDVERARRDAVDLATRLAKESEARLLEIRRREETQRQLVAAQRRDVLATFAGGLAHDFNNLLTVVYEAFERAQAEVRPFGVAAEALTLGKAAADSTGSLTRQLLAYSRGDHDGKTPTDLAPLVRTTLAIVRRLLPSYVEIRSVAPSTLPPVLCAPTQIQQVLLNLAVNARDAMPDGGRLDITARADGDAVELLVTDTGTGIDPAIAPRIFEPLFSTKAPGQGTGLGLSVVAMVVSDHGGTVTVKSQPGAGTTFEVRLPLAVAAEPAAPIAATN
ncbi:MAG TPA: ATP-binding protein [Polyangia bacterium]|nr:ATP-binding protein [Polyangia bacterium]